MSVIERSHCIYIIYIYMYIFWNIAVSVGYTYIYYVIKIPPVNMAPLIVASFRAKGLKWSKMDNLKHKVLLGNNGLFLSSSQLCHSQTQHINTKCTLGDNFRKTL